jgi:hypothetical protein
MGFDEVALIEVPVTATADEGLVIDLIGVVVCAEDPALAREGMGL